MINIIFFGPPGAGKGTQAKIISNKLSLPHLSTGDILRSKIKQNDNLALEVKDIIANGKLVPDNILNKIVSEKLIDDCKNGFILDGYPRTLDQSKFLNNLLNEYSLNLNYIFNISVNFELLTKRILNRSIEENREDDNADVIKTRYQEYKNTTQKVSDFYKTDYKEIFHEVDGDAEIEEITKKIIKILKNWWFLGKIYHFSTWLEPYKSCIHPHLFP